MSWGPVMTGKKRCYFFTGIDTDRFELKDTIIARNFPANDCF